jgi:predicted nucleic acid-binding protein
VENVMLVVSNTSPITSLFQIGRAGILPAIFGRVLIPSTVASELLRFHPLLADFVEVRAIHNQLAAKPKRLSLPQNLALTIAKGMAKLA